MGVRNPTVETLHGYAGSPLATASFQIADDLSRIEQNSLLSLFRLRILSVHA